jgi:hypothetical protein
MFYDLIAHFFSGPITLLYLGPETIMPLATIIATVVGFVLIFWRLIVNSIKKLFLRGSSGPVEEEVVNPDMLSELSDDQPQMKP